MTVPSNYFYDGQIRRFISQFIRMVSNFYVEFGRDSNGVTSLQRVPVIYGDQSRQATQIIRNNSTSTLNAVPAMAVYVSGLAYDQARLQDPSLITSLNIRQRRFDPTSGTYLEEQGDAFTVERLMPAPYKLTLKLDIWTSNTEQKLQLIEQLSQLFNPAMEIQSTDNYIDWSSLSYVLLTDMNWDSRTVPTSSEEPISIATMTFELPIWISTSVKVKKLGVIQKVVNNLLELPDFNTLGQVLVTPLNYGIMLNSFPDGSNTLQLVKSTDIITNDLYTATSFTNNVRHIWAPLLEEYGTILPGSTQIRVSQPGGSEIVGTIVTHPTDPTLLLYSPFADTLPANTIDPVDAIIDPLNVDINSFLLSPASGTRYLIINDVGSTDNAQGPIAWAGMNGIDLVAHANDIIQFNGSHWVVSFDSYSIDTLQYVTNLTTGIQYQWSNNVWAKSYEGVYAGGQWGIAI